MAVTVNQPEQISDRSWRFGYSSNLGGTPTFRAYWQGLLVDRSTNDEVRIQQSDEPIVEVYDDATTPNQWTYPGRVRLQWYHVDAATMYRVQEYVSGAWTTRANLSDLGAGYYSWLSRWLEDETAHQFRVLAMDDLRNVGAAVAHTATIVRNPSVPGVALSYASGTGLLTVAAA